jgi:putative flippase GtrA
LKIINKIQSTALIKYLIAGSIAFIFDFFSFYVGFHAFDLSITNANMLGMVAGFVSGFIFYQYWVFTGRRMVYLTFLQMTLLFFINIILINYLIDVSVNQLSMPPELSKIVLQVGVVVWNFFIYKYFIFRKKLQ